MIPGIQEIKSLAIKYSKQQLAGMAQTGLIDPQKAVLAGMMRDRIAKEDMKPPSTTVAQDVLGLSPQAQPQMGMQAQPQEQPQAQPQMGMQPQPQMPQEQPQMGAPVEQPPVMAASGGLTDIPVQMQGYAGGGIVAFGDGGDVPGYAGEKGSVVKGEEEATSTLGGYFRRFGNWLTAPDEDPEQYRARREAYIREQQSADRSRVMPWEAVTPRERASREAELGSAISRGAQINTPSRLPSPDPQLITPLMGPGVTPAPAPTEKQLPLLASPAPRGIPTSSTLQAPTLGSFDPNAIKLEGARMDIPKVEELADVRAGRRAAEAEEGVDPEMYKRMIEGVETKKGKLEGKKGEAAGQALMAAGLGLLGARRGQEFQTLGASGQKALAAYKNDIKDLRNASEKYDERMETLRMADQQAKKTNSAADIAKRDAQEARAQTAKMEVAKAQNELTKTGAQVSANVYGTQTQAGTAAYTAQLSAQTQREVANLSAQTQQAIASRPPAEIQAIEILAQRTGKPFVQAMQDFYAARQAPKQALTREDALKIVAPSMPMATPEQLNAAADRLMAGTGGGGAPQPVDYVKQYGLSPVPQK